MNRFNSLSRLLNSLKDAHYDGDKVHLDVFVDYPPTHTVAAKRKLAKKLRDRVQVIRVLENFEWPHGTKMIHVRIRNAGLIGGWLESWWPNDDRQVGLVLEDDLSVSKFYYRWIKKAVKKYLWDPSNFDPHAYGISLQRQHLVPYKGHTHKVSVPGNCPYKYMLVGSWGQLFFPKAFKQFRIWFEKNFKDPHFHPVVNNMVTTDWYKALKDTTKPWTMYIIRWAAEAGFYTMYTNFPGKQSLCTNYREPGLHYHGRAEGPDTQLITHWDPRQHECFPNKNDIPIYDYSFKKLGSANDIFGRYTFIDDIKGR